MHFKGNPFFYRLYTAPHELKFDPFYYSGESASIFVEQSEKEGELHGTDKDDFLEEKSTGKKSNHVSLLQRNERQFYDNLLV